mmetsp:Transcript_126162/g.288796  ORF Transcript_126162/g.288796 Transcript_126162/m.288796 type:complete len:218 (+) Transcript_126162:267-920(+)
MLLRSETYLRSLTPTCWCCQRLQRSDVYHAFPVLNSSCGFHGARSRTSCSKHFWTVFRLGIRGGVEVLLVGVHLKAVPNAPRSCAQREAQARVLSDIVREHGFQASREIIIAGDFNDFDASNLDLSGSLPVSTVLHHFIVDLGLEAVSRSLARADRYTWESRQGEHPPAMLDHILISQGLRDAVERVWIDHSSRASDHFPLVVDFRLQSRFDIAWFV